MQLKNRNYLPETIIASVLFGSLSLLPVLESGVPAGLILVLSLAVFVSFWHGRSYGILSLLLSMLLWTGGSVILRRTQIPWVPLINILAAGMILSYLSGSIRTARQNRLNKILFRFRKSSITNTRLNKVARAQQEIITELEERVTRQKSSLNLLYQSINAIDCLDTNQSISRLLDTIIHFTEAGSLSLRVFDPSANQLKLRLRKGDEGEDFSREPLSLQNTIEGWVFRNNQIFSLRMALDYENLHLLNTDGSIICCPVVLDNKTWGVITVESLPFIKYSEYTENLIQIIISLAQPALKKALDFENLLIGEEYNEETKLPQFTQLYRVLDKSRYDESGISNSSSLIIIEFPEFSSLSDRYGRKKTLEMQAELVRELAGRHTGSPEIFHYRQDSTMALFIPHMDYDGCSLYCLESLEYINGKRWNVEGEILKPDVCIGYASSGTNEKMDPDELMKQAEYLLEIQKI